MQRAVFVKRGEQTSAMVDISLLSNIVAYRVIGEMMGFRAESHL